MTRGAAVAADSAVVEGVAITHPDRVLDPEGGLTKLIGEVVREQRLKPICIKRIHHRRVGA